MGSTARPSALRTVILFLGIVGGLAAQGPPRVGTIDFYGLRKVPVDKVRKELGFQEGDVLPRSKGDVEERLESIPGIVRARLEAACCEESKAIVYVGFEEKGAPTFPFHNPPQGLGQLPEEIHAAYALFLQAVEKAARKGDAGEDLSAGHSLMHDTDARAIQERFVVFAEKYLPQLRDVLRNSADSEQRAMASYIIGYTPKKRLVVDDLQYAMQDPEDTVRGNAMRALGAMAVLAMKDPELEIRISPTWFIEMLDSIIWTDRNNAAVTLVNMTESRDARILDHMKTRALPAIIEMARWKHLPHALPAFILAGRIAGMPEKEIQDAWSAGNREPLLQRALKTGTPAKHD